MTSAARRIAVVGPGLLGLGIAHVPAGAGVEVVVGRDAAAARAGPASGGIVREVEMRGLDRRGSRRHRGESA